MLKKNRIASVELLRIISMLMIIAYHWELHGNNGKIIFSPLSIKQFFSFAIGSWGTVGVDLFFIISSYFLLKSKYIKINRIIILIIKVSLYGTVILLIANLAGITEFNLVEMIKSVLGVFAYQYWFIVVYLVIYCLHPTINMVITRLSEKYYLFILCILLFCTYGLGFIFTNELVGRLACGITIYFLIGFLEKYPQKKKRFSNYGLLICLSGILGILFAECLLSYIGMKYLGKANSIINRMQMTQSPVMLIVSCSFFYFIFDKNISGNKVIDFLGKYSVGAYLLHGGSSFIKNYLWDDLLKAGELYRSGPLLNYISHYIISVIAIFGIGCLAEYIVDYFIQIFVNRIMSLKTTTKAQDTFMTPIDR